ncbi:DcaP family trimeric outer membrane transporter [Aliikangiella sp. G2MR2-5]|uniref:DcaP family trimeric outer membrane transporter n=1 Tax=Aliikangiella sp. G2MR2-5 TaxID=2788943 RepID=UPI0018AC417E|nr:DcaP family trimeric outer membrane transporter [Aliikangiella sp. G2MR2-5]
MKTATKTYRHATTTISKTAKILAVSLAIIPLLMTTSPVQAEESVDERINQLEAQIKALRIAQQEQKNKQTQNSTAKDSKHTYQFGGFIKATATLSDYSDGDLDANSGLRDFYIPGAIPVGGEGEAGDFDFSAKETRINFKSTHLLDNGKTVKTYLEMDFLLPPGGNERVSNSYNPRLRHAFFTYDNWLFGQTWSTFQDVGALPESVDFLAAPDGIVFDRQPQVRYTSGAWQFSLENPETTITPFGGGGRIVTDDNSTPDFVLRYNYKADWGHISAAALLRSLAYNNGSSDESESAAGFSLTGKYAFSNGDNIKFNYASGSGLGRYVALNTSNGAVLNATGELNAIDSNLYAIAYQHKWNSQWRSNLIVSGTSVDNDTQLTGTSVTESVNSYQLNLLYSPTAKMTIGVGYLDATRELENGQEGKMDRLIFTAKYGF